MYLIVGPRQLRWQLSECDCGKLRSGEDTGTMKRKKVESKSSKPRNPSLVRASISFPSNLYGALSDLAKQKKVSLAWVVRDAAETYVANQGSLMHEKNHG